eukprot:6833656-Prymnesium_polylepis.2
MQIAANRHSSGYSSSLQSVLREVRSILGMEVEEVGPATASPEEMVGPSMCWDTAILRYRYKAWSMTEGGRAQAVWLAAFCTQRLFDPRSTATRRSWRSVRPAQHDTEDAPPERASRQHKVAAQRTAGTCDVVRALSCVASARRAFRVPRGRLVHTITHW